MEITEKVLPRPNEYTILNIQLHHPRAKILNWLSFSTFNPFIVYFVIPAQAN